MSRPASVASALKALERLHPKRIDLSLGRMHAVLDALGHPETKVPPVIHVAGTNGKGSVVAYMRSILEAAGLRVHAYTSPHLVRFHERIRLAGSLIGDEALAAVLERVIAANGEAPLTFFEATTAAAFLAFAETPADVLLLETGLGGRLDATNVIDRPLLSIITPIGLDHHDFLGPDIASIAGEKAGIMKPDVTCLAAAQHPEALAVLEKAACDRGATLWRHGAKWRWGGTSEGLRIVLHDQAWNLPFPSLLGAHQHANAALAAASVMAVADRWVVTEAHARAGVAKASWPARMQRLQDTPLNALLPEGAALWLDGGHNGDAAAALAAVLAAQPGPRVLVLGMISSKDPGAFLDSLAPHVDHVITVPVDEGTRAGIAPHDLAAFAAARGMPVQAAKDVPEALSLAASAAPHTVLVAGSLYLAGAVLRVADRIPV